MDAIRKELGESDGSVADEYRRRSPSRHAGCGAQQAERELAASSGWASRTPSRR
jgi:hypothetical protein